MIGNQGGAPPPPPDFRGKSWQVLDFCWQVLLNWKKLAGFKISSDFEEKNWQVVDFWQVAIRKSCQVLLKKVGRFNPRMGVPPHLILKIIAGLN